MNRRRPTRSRAGAGLIEILIAVTLTVLVLGGVVQSMNRGLGAFRVGNANNEIESRAARTMSRLVRELMGASAGNIQPDLVTLAGNPTVWSPSIDFRIALAWNDGAIGWSELRRLSWALAPGELDNGVDDNGDGLVDEGALVYALDAGTPDETPVVLVSGVRELLEGESANGADDNGNGLVDESGLAFDLDGDILTIRISLERTGPDGDPIIRTQQVSIRLRNSNS